jgi:hypothetical protein
MPPRTQKSAPPSASTRSRLSDPPVGSVAAPAPARRSRELRSLLQDSRAFSAASVPFPPTRSETELALEQVAASAAKEHAASLQVKHAGDRLGSRLRKEQLAIIGCAEVPHVKGAAANARAAAQEAVSKEEEEEGAARPYLSRPRAPRLPVYIDRSKDSPDDRPRSFGFSPTVVAAAREDPDLPAYVGLPPRQAAELIYKRGERAVARAPRSRAPAAASGEEEQEEEEEEEQAEEEGDIVQSGSDPEDESWSQSKSSRSRRPAPREAAASRPLTPSPVPSTAPRPRKRLIRPATPPEFESPPPVPLASAGPRAAHRAPAGRPPPGRPSLGGSKLPIGPSLAALLASIPDNWDRCSASRPTRPPQQPPRSPRPPQQPPRSPRPRSSARPA